MGQRPIIKNGKVVNVIEIDDDVQIVTKAEHKAALEVENAAHAADVSAWRAEITKMRDEVSEAHQKAALAMGAAEALKDQARKDKNAGKPPRLFDQILDLEAEAKAHAEEAGRLALRPKPPEPTRAHVRRWFHPLGLEVGPPGGSIGDTWDGRQYAPPPVEREASEK